MKHWMKHWRNHRPDRVCRAGRTLPTSACTPTRRSTCGDRDGFSAQSLHDLSGLARHVVVPTDAAANARNGVVAPSPAAVSVGGGQVDAELVADLDSLGV